MSFRVLPATDALWLVVFAPSDAETTAEMSDEELSLRYPDGLHALPPELANRGEAA